LFVIPGNLPAGRQGRESKGIKNFRMDARLKTSGMMEKRDKKSFCYEEVTMKVEQISVFLENKSGRLAEVAEVLAGAGVNIRALSLADTTDFGILRLIVNDTEKAKKVLRDNGFTVGKTEVLAVEVSDRPGGLATILNVMKDNGINVEYMYAFVQKSGGNAIIIFRFDELDKAIETLQKAGIRILKGEDVYAL
jgi:hypothetical protein